MKQFRQAIAIDPRYAKAHNNLGVALMRSNQLGAAALEFRAALAADGRNVESLVNLALVQKATGRTADARDLLRRAVTLDPRNAGCHYNLAVVADESGDSATAVIKATTVDGVYSADPKRDPNATKYARISYRDVMLGELRVMDQTAITLCKENELPLIVLNIHRPGALARAVRGESEGTLVR